MRTHAWQGMVGLALVMLVACSPGTPAAQPVTEEVGTVVNSTAMPSEIVAPQPPTQTESEISISLENVSFVIPAGLAGGATSELMPAVSGEQWEAVPVHLKIVLADYVLQGTFHQPQIFVYGVDEYVNVNTSSAEQMDRIREIVAGSSGSKENLPVIPWFNAQPMIAAHIQTLPFENGQGVRTLTLYSQYYAPINNNELFYHFEGLTTDNQFYMIAILPITAPILVEDASPDAPVPEGGIPIPVDTGDMEEYYLSVTERLNSLDPNAFTPSIHTLDELIQSIHVTTP